MPKHDAIEQHWRYCDNAVEQLPDLIINLINSTKLDSKKKEDVLSDYCEQIQVTNENVYNFYDDLLEKSIGKHRSIHKLQQPGQWWYSK